MTSRYLLALFLCGCSCSRGWNTPPDGGRASGSGTGGAGQGGGQQSSTSSGFGGNAEACELGDTEIDIGVDCTLKSPEMEYEPVLKWTFSAEPGYNGDGECAAVANLDDDNQDGKVDLCDVPDVILMTVAGWIQYGTLHVLSGADGSPTGRYPAWLSGGACPAVGDLDADGAVEIVVLESSGRLVALRSDLTELWRAPDAVYEPCLVGPCNGTPSSAIAVHDLEGDGQAEILVGTRVYEHDGALRFAAEPEYMNDHWANHSPDNVIPTVADLDGDGVLEVLMGPTAYDASGAVLWSTGSAWRTPHATDVDQDGVPEVVLLGAEGLTLVDASGTTLYESAAAGFQHRLRSRATVADLDGDGGPELGIVAIGAVAAYDLALDGAPLLWSAPAPTTSGTFKATSYPFGASSDVFVSQGTGIGAFTGGTGQLGPTATPPSGPASFDVLVADVDNDKSADLVVTYNNSVSDVQLAVFEDALKRFSPARRIWNQEAYVAESIREDGRLVAHPDATMSFRAQRRRQCLDPAR